MSAFEELLEWCDKHLPVGSYQAIEESNSYHRTVYLDVGEEEQPYMAFDSNGGFIGIGILTDEDRLEHFLDLEATERERGTISCEK